MKYQSWYMTFLYILLGFSIGGLVVYTYFPKSENLGTYDPLWFSLFSPRVEQFSFCNVTYYCVIIGHDIAFASRNATEAIQWSIDYTEEWSWVWDR